MVLNLVAGAFLSVVFEKLFERLASADFINKRRHQKSPPNSFNHLPPLSPDLRNCRRRTRSRCRGIVTEADVFDAYEICITRS